MLAGTPWDRSPERQRHRRGRGPQKDLPKYFAGHFAPPDWVWDGALKVESVPRHFDLDPMETAWGGRRPRRWPHCQCNALTLSLWQCVPATFAGTTGPSACLTPWWPTATVASDKVLGTTWNQNCPTLANSRFECHNNTSWLEPVDLKIHENLGLKKTKPSWTCCKFFYPTHSWFRTGSKWSFVDSL